MTVPIPYARKRLANLAGRRTAIRSDAGIFSLTGPGAVTCLQGLVTADVAGTAPDRSAYGAMLTAKGMIIADYWIARVGGDCLLIGDGAARGPTASGFKRLLPPRLARAADHSDDWQVLWLIGSGPGGLPGLTLPAPGRAVRWPGETGDGWIIGGPERAHFAAALAGPRDAIDRIVEGLPASGVVLGTDADLRAARILAGVPTLGTDIDDKTLPQEAGFDELGGVSYSKGCYVGQETVARLHFRGRPNWVLRRIEAPPGTEMPLVVADADGKPALKPGSVLAMDDGSFEGLARVRREIAPGTAVGGCLIMDTTEPRP